MQKFRFLLINLNMCCLKIRYFELLKVSVKAVLILNKINSAVNLVCFSSMEVIFMHLTLFTLNMLVFIQLADDSKPLSNESESSSNTEQRGHAQGSIFVSPSI